MLVRARAARVGSFTQDVTRKYPQDGCLGEWLLFFLRCLLKQKDVLARKMERERLMAARPPLSEQLLQLIREHGRLTMTAAVKLTGANRNTIKVHLRQLVESGELRLQGQGRGSWYELA